MGLWTALPRQGRDQLTSPWASGPTRLQTAERGRQGEEESFPVWWDVRLLLLLRLLWSDAIKDRREMDGFWQAEETQPRQGVTKLEFTLWFSRVPRVHDLPPYSTSGLCIASNMTVSVFCPYCLASLWARLPAVISAVPLHLRARKTYS